jgi:hypothetical protein
MKTDKPYLRNNTFAAKIRADMERLTGEAEEKWRIDMEKRGTLTDEICEMLSIMTLDEMEKIHTTMTLITYKLAYIPDLCMSRLERELPEHLKRVEMQNVVDRKARETGQDYLKLSSKFSKKKALNTNCAVFFEEMDRRYLKREEKETTYKYLI